MEKDNEKIFYIDVDGHHAYFNYDNERQTLTRRDVKVTITPERLADFLHTADLFGFKTGTV